MHDAGMPLVLGAGDLARECGITGEWSPRVADRGRHASVRLRRLCVVVHAGTAQGMQRSADHDVQLKLVCLLSSKPSARCGGRWHDATINGVGYRLTRSALQMAGPLKCLADRLPPSLARNLVILRHAPEPTPRDPAQHGAQ